MQSTMQRTRPAWPAKTKLRMTLNCPRSSQAANLETQKQTKSNPKRSAKVIDRTEKLEISSKFAKRAVKYNEFGYNEYYISSFIVALILFLTFPTNT